MSEKRVVKSACRMCHGVCQVLVHLDGDRVIKVTGDPDSLTSKGYLCPKGAASPELLYHPDRLKYPLRRAGQRGENKWQRISWDEALDEMAARLTMIKKDSGSEYFGMMQGTGRPYTGFTTRFANAFGTPNFTGVAHLCYFPRWIASLGTLGQLPVADVYGFGNRGPECIVIWGCNITHTGASDGMCGGRVERALRQAKKIIVIDPRRIGPADRADHWLQLRPGTDGALALAMLHVVIAEELYDHEFVEKYTNGFEKLRVHVRPFTPEWAAPITRLKADDIRAAARTYAGARPACIQWGNALDMSMSNYQTARAILILSGICGNIDAPGGDALWVAPEGIKQRSIFRNLEVAGLQFLPPEKAGRRLDGGRFPLCPAVHPPTFWRSIVSGDPYRLRAFWVVGSNPLTTMTNTADVEAGLKLLEYTVVSEIFMTPTAQLADLVLPAASWLEQDEVVNIHKIWCVLARKKVAQIGETMDDREIIIQLARRLGLTEAFPWKNYREYLEWVLEDASLTFEEFCERGMLAGEQRYYKYKTQGFETPSGKLEIYNGMMAILGRDPLPVYREPPLTPVSAPELAKEYPLILTTGAKIRAFFHSEGRQIESLRKANPDPLVEVHPQTASSLGIRDGDWVFIETPHGKVKMRAKLTGIVAPDVVSAQHAWWFPEQAPPDYGYQQSNVNLLFGPMAYDPDTGSESLRSALCRVYPEGESKP
ncbi:MAG: dehydrogenase [Deltaproteobacteria bacterium RBG_13_61_14]|nr:MAG: dehydrogenase [Deltaproteobacteria bacterium RBG_13_61_14]